MKKSHRFLLSIVMLGAFLLSACGGAAPQLDDSQSPSGEFIEVVFTGSVESMGGGEWIVSGQQVLVDGASVDANIQVGDIVRVEANVSGDGSVFAVKIESSSPDDVSGANDNSANDNSSNANDDDANSNDANSNDDDANGNDNDNDNANDNDNTNDNDNESAGDEQEIYGVVQAIGIGTITVDDVTYNLTGATEFNDAIAVGDQVEIYVIVNADGTLTIREIEKVDGTSIGDDNDNSDDDNSNDDDSNGNSNDDDDDDDDNSNDDNGNDDDSNSNGNG